ncbi:hypothetical protein CTI12_AA582460 [Artemisia annua]|uniref:Uncharacterized protein n=1 Tax=Artemisia annua TaxID=35608 RepID=A0A2U1KNG5_ARTAN|nr:hypothetical protein CTI12_AA582460 [Artemisia annua]
MYQTGITEEGGDAADQEDSFAKPSDLRRCSDFMWKVVEKRNAAFIKILMMIIFWKFMAVLLVKLPWKIIAGGDKSKDDGDDSKAPVIEEITFPSVMEMAKAWILFSPVNGGIPEIDFNNKTSTLSLPVINLGVNTEVYLRNLVAYEVCVTAGPLVVARYTELMNGIIDTEEDAKFLRERRIVLNRLKSDMEVEDLWNRMKGFVEAYKKKGKGKLQGTNRQVDGIRIQKPKVSYYYRAVTKPKNGGASTSNPSVKFSNGVNIGSTSCNEPATDPTISTAPSRDDQGEKNNWVDYINIVDLKNSFDVLTEQARFDFGTCHWHYMYS